MASYVVTELAELQVHMEPIVNFDMDHYRMLHQRLIEHEELIFGTSIQVQVWRHSFLQEYFSFASTLHGHRKTRKLLHGFVKLGSLLRSNE